HQDIKKATESVMSTTGEVSSIAFAGHLLDLIEAQNNEDLDIFLTYLMEEYDINTDSLLKNVEAYSKERNNKNLGLIGSFSEPGWVELFRRLNATPGGTHRLIKLRERIKLLLRDGSPHLKALDDGLLKLFRYWFNSSFLVLEKIDWSTPANVLEKIIEYEAVHEINSWNDLRARLAPSDRQCFAFFHPLIPEDPLIFVEVALTNERSSLVLTNEKGVEIVVVQIAGLIARRILSFVTANQGLDQGERYGLIRFGSRVDIYLPIDSKINCNVGDKVVAGESVLATLAEGL
ncbi:malonyl-CoA decarboxylase family protein, partial [Gammaproteobacteria bacterium]|nr:malonyl-CoA decarboxylase family protein [Gammaproteobacteria bacterium]